MRTLDHEFHYLRTEIYRWPDADPPLKRLTAFDASGRDASSFSNEE